MRAKRRGCRQTLKNPLYPHWAFRGIRPPHCRKKGFDVYRRSLWTDHSNIPWVIAEMIGSITFEHTEDVLHDIILTSKLQMPDILIPVICSDPFVSNEFRYVVFAVAN